MNKKKLILSELKSSSATHLLSQQLVKIKHKSASQIIWTQEFAASGKLGKMVINTGWTDEYPASSKAGK
jgi:hypothetical protein